MASRTLRATKLNDSWDIPIDNFEKVVRRGPRQGASSYDGVTTEPGNLRPPDVLVRSSTAANFLHLVGKEHVNFRVEDSDGTVRVKFYGFVHSVRGDRITIKSHSLW